LAVVGHDPSIGEFAAVLDDGQCSPAAQRELDVGFHTSGVAVALA
jgi:phosphohistidine phosphatase